MAGSEAELVTPLRTDPLATRRRAAACTFITYPTPSTSLPGTLVAALVGRVAEAQPGWIRRTPGGGCRACGPRPGGG
nr:hypothetical protein GCM10020063_042450 [Dactylosporangium thailandense]